jgi:3-oxoacyl-[acyl-carrier-protein] synthase II
MERVVVTGMDIITSLGLNLETSWNNLVEGKSGVKKISLFDASENQTQFAAEIPAEFEELWPTYIKKRSADQMTRITKACFVSAKQAVNMSGLDFETMDKNRCAVILGVVTTANSSSEKGTTVQNRILKSMNNAMSAWISLEFKLQGPNFTVASACASEKASKPFSKNRDGFVIGEGAGILILESLSHAQARHATILAEMAGYAISSEAYNIMAPMKDGEGIAHTIDLALKNSGLQIGDIDYINAHGTSTMLNDKYETMAIKRVFGEKAYQIPVSSSKSMIGHTIGAAGAIELVITVQSMLQGILTPTINLDEPDPELDLDYVPNQARKKEINCAVSNSFAFGGHNAVLIIKKFK